MRYTKHDLRSKSFIWFISTPLTTLSYKKSSPPTYALELKLAASDSGKQLKED
jgi:hypothetical protein